VADRLALATAEIDVDFTKPPIEAEPIPGPPALKWKFKTDGWVFSSPVIAANAVFFGSRDGHLCSVDCGSGHLNWGFRTGDVIRSSPVYMSDTVYIGSWDRCLYAIDATTGKARWRFPTGKEIWCAPAVREGTVYFTSTDGNLYALDAHDGLARWKCKMGSPMFNWVESAPVVFEDLILCGRHDGRLVALDSSSGKLKWSFETNGPVDSSPLVADNTFFSGPRQAFFMLWRHKRGKRNGDMMPSAPYTVVRQCCGERCFSPAQEGICTRLELSPAGNAGRSRAPNRFSLLRRFL